MTHLFLITITPVQSFISQARKTQDLYAGSRILSELSKGIASAIEAEGGILIFPSKTEGNSLPNRLLAEFSFPNETDLKQKGNTIAESISKNMNIYHKNAQNKLGSNFHKIKVEFEKQLESFFSTFWVFVLLDKEDYEKAYDKADRLLGAVKNIRTFEQNPEQGRKCSLSGEQNALVFGKSNFFPSYVDNAKACFYLDPIVQEKEGLSAISFIKRTEQFDDKDSFDSTADIAILRSRQIVGEAAFKAYKDMFKLLKAAEKEKCLFINGEDWTDYNEQFIYEENLIAKNIPCKHQLKIAKEYHDKLKKIFKEKGSKFTKYYAIILFDADSMGEWLSGGFLEDKKQLKNFQIHLSGLLSGFAERAKNFVDGREEAKRDLTKAKGRTVYAGGDDYLGFVNLHYLFDVLQALREMFRTEVSNKLQANSDGVKFKLIKDEMTFSAGITVAHYKTPLSEVLKWGRNMEKEAKATDNKDAFGLAILKHSGEIHKTVLPFKGDFTSKLNDIVEALNEEFSNTFITSLEREMMFIADNDSDDLDYSIREALMFEADRLIKRSKKSDNVNVQKMQSSVKSLMSTSIRTTENSPLVNFRSALGICDFINRKTNSND